MFSRAGDFDYQLHAILLSLWVLFCGVGGRVYDLVPKGVQEKRTEVLENKVDRMWVSNAFFEWTRVKSSTSEGRRQCCSLFLRNLTFSVICDKMLNITHYNKPHHCAANHAVNCENPTDLTRYDPHEYYQVNCCCSVLHRTACYA